MAMNDAMASVAAVHLTRAPSSSVNARQPFIDVCLPICLYMILYAIYSRMYTIP
jgi:hypothetical protein